MRHETVEALYNAVCIALWAPFNEGWGQFDAVRAAREIKAQDPHPPCGPRSGWHDQGGPDVCACTSTSKR